ncbi:hypothetical protein SEA_THYATIRA_77 [Mycobacterium phage Thyatira]|uniref:Uncharacterized protein n=2 Tax=Kratiovirus TaxID=2948788 RepID=A0A345M9A4_9CAUD|nr:hypothetical protein PBI_OKIROE_77 [Mycobacterium phage OkiRoe]YP_009282321.1 hypothetical protein SEA_GENGAR_76 [Mycobacterium phage Gengar]YP_009951066.1 hypothetical protein I5G76_gp24 [Mycobacterium phage Thyatira]AOQ28933.1 hypothetical protein SEA_WATERFOUL_76 [Mycobacterium phage Waterfoul]AHZ95638.1 hypothetical protein PBI_OKIROE_77 [Mycobacterium phage OkiRoe]AON96731.1 hypothetical protein SEA_GENGAR_76 [Mycobacterium phage Gengar]AXH67075.1 hypothetical protein SEA_THYATIRA_77 
MLSVEPGMDVARQRRKIVGRIQTEDDDHAAAYLIHLLAQFDKSVTAGKPRPAREFLYMFAEEFDRSEPK